MPTTHDLVKHVWGNGVSLTMPVPDPEGQNAILLRIAGHSHTKIVKGDYILLANGEHSTRYIVDEIDYMLDVTDMFKALVRFYPRYTCTVCGAQYDPPMPDSCAVCDQREADSHGSAQS
jgi:hypothetical protein